MRESPTVAVADTDSYKTSSALASHTADSNTLDTNSVANEVRHTAIALPEIFLEMVLPNKTGSFLPVITDDAVANKTAKVTVLIPPAVPTGEPPINIRKSERIAVAFVRFSCGRVAKPAVLSVMD